MAFQTEQIYTIVNEAASQALGTTALKAINTSTFVSLGNQVLSSNQNVESFLNVLPQRIGQTIFANRPYVAKSHDMWMSDMQWGAIMQKITVGLFESEKDESYDLTQGGSVDQYKINKPTSTQKLFVTRTPYQFHVTIARKQLKEAFLSESKMAAFIAYVMQRVQDSIVFAFDNLAKSCLANMMAETTHVVNLVTLYNATLPTDTEGDPIGAVTSTNCMYDNAFMRFALATIKTYSKGLTDMGSNYNDGTADRHTPYSLQRIKINSQFQTMLETQVQYAAFHDNYVKLDQFTEYNYWQSQKSPMAIQVKRASDDTEVAINNIVAVIHDRDALGLFKEDEEVLTTPVNAAGRYYNTYYHMIQLWFNDLSENFVLFTLN